MALLNSIKSFFRKKKDEEEIGAPVPAPAPTPINIPQPKQVDLTNTIKQGVDSASQAWQKFWQPSPDGVRTRDFLRELPSATAKVGDTVLDWTVRPIITRPVGKTITSLAENAGLAPIAGPNKGKVITQLDTNNRAGRLIFGKDPVKSYQQETRDVIDWEKKIGIPERIATPTGVFLGMANVALDLPSGSAAKKIVKEGAEKIAKEGGIDLAKKVAIETGEDLASFLKDGLNVPSLNLTSGARQGARLPWEEVKTALKDLGLSKKLEKDLNAGKVIEGTNFVLQKNGDILIANIDSSFETIKKAVEPVVEPVTQKLKGVKLSVPKIVEEVPKVVEPRFVDSKLFAKSLDNAKAGKRKALSDIKMPEYWNEADIDRTQVDMVKAAVEAGDRINPIVLDEAGNVLDGAHRLQALTELGVKDVDTVVQKVVEKPQPFLDVVASKAKEFGNEDILKNAQVQAENATKVIEDFKQPLQEKGVLESVSANIGDALNKVPAYRAIADPVQDFFHSLGKYRFGDQALDIDAKAIERAKIGFVERSKRIYSDALVEAQEILGREINQEEAGALLRSNYAGELANAVEGVTSQPLGKDIAANATQLEQVFKSVHSEIASYVLMHEKELESLLEAGKISPEQAAKLRLVQPEKFAENLNKYVRTFYNKDATDFTTAALNPFAIEETRINFSTAKKKLSDYEWGNGYLMALQNGHPEEVTRRLAAPADDIVKKALGGDDAAIADLGRQVKEMRGLVTQGDAVVERTVYNLLNSYKDLKLESVVADRPDLFSTVLKDGFAAVPNDKGYGPLAGKYVREDVAKELFADKEQIQNTTDTISNAINAYGSAWKFAKTILNPSTWGINFMTGMTTMQTLAGNSPFSPANWKYFTKASELFDQLPKGNVTSDTLKQFVDLGGSQSGFVDIEILNSAKELYADMNPKVFGKKFAETLSKFADKPEKLGQFYSYIDGYNKYATFLNKIDHGYDVVDAMKFADKYHLNYAVLPKWVRTLKQSAWGNALVPFVSFTAQFPKMIIETAVSKPWRFAPLYLVPMAYNLAWKASNPALAEQSEMQKPDYARNNPFVITLGYDETKKEFDYFDMGRLYALPGDMEPESIARFFLGPFSNVGGPLSSIADAVKGVDSFGNELNTPGNQTSAEHIVQGVAPVPNIVFQLADTYKSLTGQPARGKLRDPLDETLRMAGITILHGSADQLSKSISAAQREYSNWQSWTKKQLQDPRLSEGARSSLLEDLETKRADLTNKVNELLETKTDSPVEQINPLTQVILPKLDTAALPTVDLTNLPSSKLTAGSKSKAKPKSVTLKLPKAKAIKFSKPKETEDFEPSEITPPKRKGVRLASRKAPSMPRIKVPKVSGLRVS